MSSYSAESKILVKKVIEPTDCSTIADNTQSKYELFNKVEKAFSDISRLREMQSISTHMNVLNDICLQLVTESTYELLFAFKIFIMILKEYIKLLDNEQFIDVIQSTYSKGNIDFLGNLFHITHHCHLESLVQTMSKQNHRDIFFSLLDQLNSSKRLHLCMNSYQTNNRTLTHSLNFVLYSILITLNELEVCVSTNNDFEKYQHTVFPSLINYAHQYFVKKEFRRVSDCQNELLIEKICQFIIHVTHKTLTIPLFINIDLPKTCLQWLSLSYLSITEYRWIVMIMFNIARHDEGAVRLNQLDCVNIIGQFKSDVLSQNIDVILNKHLHLFISECLDLTLGLTVDRNEFCNMKMNNVIHHILSITDLASKSDDFVYEGFHISEPLVMLMKLCTNDKILTVIFQKTQYLNTCCTILNKLLTYIESHTVDDDFDINILAVIALANIIWSVSFHDVYKHELKQNVRSLKRLELFRETSMFNRALPCVYRPREMISLKRTMDGIWYNLYPFSPKKMNRSSSASCLVMISYSHVNINFCRKICNEIWALSGLTTNVNLNTGKYLWKEIMESIDQSDLVLFLLSEDFFYDKSCRQELVYVTEVSKKLFFPIFIDRNFQPIDWLHKQISRLRSVRFDETNFMQSFEELIAMINEHVPLNGSLKRNASDIKKWSEQEIKEWFLQHHIPSELYEFYQFRNGYELALYAQAILKFPWIHEYERIKQRYQDKFQHKILSQEQFFKFVNALECSRKYFF